MGSSFGILRAREVALELSCSFLLQLALGVECALSPSVSVTTDGTDDIIVRQIMMISVDLLLRKEWAEEQELWWACLHFCPADVDQSILHCFRIMFVKDSCLWRASNIFWSSYMWLCSKIKRLWSTDCHKMIVNLLSQRDYLLLPLYYSQSFIVRTTTKIIFALH